MGYADIAGIILIAFFAFRNANRAKQKEQSAVLWAFITMVLFFVCAMIGYFLVVMLFHHDLFKQLVEISSRSLSYNSKPAQDIAEQLAISISNNPLDIFTIVLFGIGGYLIVRYILDSKPDKKKPEAHWMDKMGEQEQ